MLEIVVPAAEYYDESSGEFVTLKETKLQLEHSLLSISKWEAKWKKPFLVSKPSKTATETIDYIRCMTLTKNVNPAVYSNLSKASVEEINRYIETDQTATTFSGQSERPSRETITSEVIYYMMCAYGIPFECQKWHLSRLLALLKICQIKNSKPKKMSKRDIMAKNRSLNAARRKKFNTKG